MSAPAQRKRRTWLPLLTIAVAVAVLAAAITVASLQNRGSSGASTAQPATADTTTMPNMVGMSVGAAGAALRSLGFTQVRTTPMVADSKRPVTGQDPKAGTLVAKDVPVMLTLQSSPVTTTVAPPVVPPSPPRAITAREWALIARNPDGYIGQSIIVYGQVTQFDSATGLTGFRANVDGVQRKASYGYVDYNVNTMLAAGSAATLGDLVNKDLFKAEVVVEGSYSYETTMGGSMTVPKLSVQKITVTGQAK